MDQAAPAMSRKSRSNRDARSGPICASYSCCAACPAGDTENANSRVSPGVRTLVAKPLRCRGLMPRTIVTVAVDTVFVGKRKRGAAGNIPRCRRCVSFWAARNGPPVRKRSDGGAGRPNLRSRDLPLTGAHATHSNMACIRCVGKIQLRLHRDRPPAVMPSSFVNIRDATIKKNTAPAGRIETDHAGRSRS
jgi:hypothetical protein